MRRSERLSVLMALSALAYWSSAPSKQKGEGRPVEGAASRSNPNKTNLILSSA
jgi:hypothetical protein